MSTYIDPSTAMSIARQARAEQISRAEQYHQTRVAQADVSAEGPQPHHRWRIAWRSAAIVH